VLTEAEGCEVLVRVFRERGFSIQLNVPFDEDGVEFNADGWDPDGRVGFEYMTHEAEDHRDLTPDEIAKLIKRMEKSELFFFIIDETDIEDPQVLEWAAHQFLDEVGRRRAALEGGAS
jgi:hypothetical protein